MEYRPLEGHEFDDFLTVDARAFGLAPRKKDAPDSWTRGEPERARGAFEGARLVGTGRNYSFELTLPGGHLLPAGAVSWIGVQPTHRRRGVLRGMLDELHRDAREHGEPVSILTASEGGIYGRFGYGVATSIASVTVPRAHGAFTQPVEDDGDVRYLERDEAIEVFPDVFERARAAQPGMVSRPAFWWPESYWDVFDEGEAVFTVVHRDAHGRDDGILYYAVQGDWRHGIAAKRLEVLDFVTLTPLARAALWRFLLDVDLQESVQVRLLPVDDPIRHLIADQRRVHVDGLHDRLWVRLHDPAAALAARRYAVEGAIVIDVRDGDGSLRLALDGGPDGATCTPTTRAPDLSLGVAALGATLLGGTSFGRLAGAGLVDEHGVRALARADAMFATHPAPATLSWF